MRQFLKWLTALRLAIRAGMQLLVGQRPAMAPRKSYRLEYELARAESRQLGQWLGDDPRWVRLDGSWPGGRPVRGTVRPRGEPPAGGAGVNRGRGIQGTS
jgi:hypothetical protein